MQETTKSMRIWRIMPCNVFRTLALADPMMPDRRQQEVNNARLHNLGKYDEVVAGLESTMLRASHELCWADALGPPGAARRAIHEGFAWSDTGDCLRYTTSQQ